MNYSILGDVCTFLSGFAWSSKKFSRSKEGIPIIRIQNVGNGIDEDTVYWPENFQERFVITEGDILLSLSGSFRAAEWHGPNALLNQRVVKISPFASVDTRWFLHWLNTQLLSIEAMGRHALVNNVALGDLKNIPIAYPDIEEQRRIAAILDKADAIRRKREQALALADDFLRATFLDMFGDPVTNPKGWTQVHLETVAEINSGLTKGRKFVGRKTVELPYMRVANVQDGFLSLDEIKTIELAEDEASRFKLSVGDILLTEGGDPDKLGRGAVWNGEIQDCVHQNHIFRVTCDANCLVPEFVSAQIASNRGKRYFLKSAKQTTGIATINKTQLKDFPLLVPPIAVQNAYKNYSSGVTNLKYDLEAELACHKKLFKSLSQRAFSGEL